MPGSVHTEDAYNFYKSIGAHQRTLSIVKNKFKIPFVETLPKFWWKNNRSLYENFNFAREKIDDWVKNGYVYKSSEQPNHISPLSVATRELYTGEKKLRLCFDATFMNDYILTEKSKLPTLKISEELIGSNDYAIVHDLRNCYFHVSLHDSDIGKVCFAFPKCKDGEGSREFEFYVVKILIYGLKPATLVIHLLTKPLIDHLLKQNVRSVIYIDDIRTNNRSKERVEADAKIVKEVFTKAGWTFAEEKETKASQSVHYLGFIFDTVTRKYSIIEGKIAQVERGVNEIKSSHQAHPRQVAKLVGKIISFELATSMLPRLCLHSYFRWIAKVVQDRRDWDKIRNVPKSLVEGLELALHYVRKFSGKIRSKHYDYEELKTSKSSINTVEFAGDGNETYGAHYCVKEPFKYSIITFSDYSDIELSSSFRELLVLDDCIKRNYKKNKSKDLVYYTDSRVLYFWFENGTSRQEVAEVLIRIISRCLNSDIILEVVWKSRLDPKIELADTSCKTDSDDYSIPNKYYDFLCSFLKIQVEVDLFASTLLHRVPTFYSKSPTLGSCGANALRFEWNKVSYCHPPKNMIYKVFKKIQAAKSLELLLIMVKTSHDTDLKIFMNDDSAFKYYVKKCVYFETRVYCPNKPTKFMIAEHSWWALHIKKCDMDFKLQFKDVYYCNRIL